MVEARQGLYCSIETLKTSVMSNSNASWPQPEISRVQRRAEKVPIG
jgi:hypothetical protein